MVSDSDDTSGAVWERDGDQSESAEVTKREKSEKSEAKSAERRAGGL